VGVVTSILFTCDRRVFFEDDAGQIRQATASERLETLHELLTLSTSAAVETDV
jgi:hypothetical protein